MDLRFGADEVVPSDVAVDVIIKSTSKTSDWHFPDPSVLHQVLIDLGFVFE